MIIEERKALLAELAKSTLHTITTFCKEGEELKFVINSMVMVVGCAYTVEDIREKSMKILQATLFKD